MRFLVLPFLLILSVASYAQTIGGSWYGRADALLGGSHNNYLTELIIKQKGDEVEGIFGYYFRDGYKSLFIRGQYNKKTRQFVVKNIPLTYFNATSIDGVECFMDLYGTLIISKVESSLKGTFTSDEKHRYTCPDLKVTYTLDIAEKNQDSLIKNSVARKIWQPRQEDIIVNTNPRMNTNPQVNTQPKIADTLARVQGQRPATRTQPEVANESRKNIDTIDNARRMQSLVETFTKRSTIMNKEVEISSDSVRISFYDNGDIDGDSISVFVNKVPVLTHQALTAQALNIYVQLDPSKEVNEITMFAENLGSIPPNTALMIINDGHTRHEVYLSSSLTQNSSVRLRRKK